MGMRLLLCLAVVLVLTPVMVRGQIPEGYNPFDSFNEQETEVKPANTETQSVAEKEPSPEWKPESGHLLWFNAKQEIYRELLNKSWSLKSRVEGDIRDLKAVMSRFEEHLDLAKTYDRSMFDQLLGGRRSSLDRGRDFETYNAMKEKLATLRQVQGELETFREYDYVKPAWKRLSEDARARVVKDRALSAKERVALKILDYLPASTKARFTNSIDLSLISIPPGVFSKVVNKYGRKRDFEVSKSTWIGETEVTRKQYERLMGPQEFDSDPKNKTTRVDPTLYPELPAIVTWYEAVAFCDALNKASEEKGEKRYYRLPTQVEWEHACRAGSITDFSFGDLKELTGKEANMAYEDSVACKHFRLSLNFDGLIPVGSFAPNAFGLYDMHGNALEWCGDWYGKNYPLECPETDPPGPEDCDVEEAFFSNGRFIFPTIAQKVMRGGAYDRPVASCTSFAVHTNEHENYKVGFRVVCEIGVPSAIARQQYAELLNHQEDRLQPAVLKAFRESLPKFRTTWELFNSDELPKGEEWLKEARLPQNRAEFAYNLFNSLGFVYGYMDAEELVLRTTAEKVKHLEMYLDQELRNQGGYTHYSLGLKRQLAFDYVSLKQFDKATFVVNELLSDFPDNPDVISLKKHLESKRSK